jgi:hypothetical protein
MIQYETFEIHKDEYVQVLKCHRSLDAVSFEDFDRIIFIIPGTQCFLIFSSIGLQSNSKRIFKSTGNPGLVEFYEQFASCLHDLTGLPIIAVSHTGHLNYKSKAWKPAQYEQQILDKIKFIQKYMLPKRTRPIRLYLIGHSIGCDIILKMLQLINTNETNVRVTKGILLFPVIERMSATPNGKTFSSLFKYFLRPILILLFIVTSLPESLLKSLVNLFYAGPDRNMNTSVKNAIYSIVTSRSCARSALIMAHGELRQVNEAALEIIDRNFEDLIFYYGKTDRWCPLSYYHDMIKRFSQNKNSHKTIILDSHDLEHAFVLNQFQTEALSKLVCQWIESGR